MRLRYAHLSRWHYPQTFDTFMATFGDWRPPGNLLSV
jgi:hypothetical protein